MIKIVERDTFVSVNDGDQLNDGYFNGIFTKFDANGLIVVDSATGLSTASTSEVEVDSVTLPASTFAATDLILIKVFGYKIASGGYGRIKVRINDGTNTHTTSIDAIHDTDKNTTVEYEISATPNLNTGLVLGKKRINPSDDTWAISNEEATMIANWITSEITISLRAFNQTSGTLNLRWVIYQMTSVVG